MQDLIYEFRSYWVQPGKAPLYLRTLQKGGIAIVTRHLPLLGFWMTETGRLNVLHHLWAYESLEERAVCRANLMADEAWVNGFIPEAFPLLQEQESRLMRLSHGSAALEAATARRKQAVAAASSDVPLFAETLHCLVVGGFQAATQADIAQFTTISGEAPGSKITITADSLLEMPCEGLLRRELIRPVAFSPLR